MMIHGLCLIKNEADVIEECLREAAKWCDQIYVYDNGSTDGTWGIVREVAKELPQVVPWRQLDKPFKDGLRAEIFDTFSSRAKPGDWWCRLDADEFYVHEPRSFLSAVDRRYGTVWYAPLSYYFSSKAAEDYERHPERYADSVPVAQRCRYYFNHWSELRFVRHELLAAEQWYSDAGWPPHVERALVNPTRMLCKHYCYRSPSQIERRIETRKAAALGGKVFQHEAIKDWSKVVDPKAVEKHKWRDVAYCTDEQLFEQGWRSRVIPAESLQFDNGHYVLNENLMPKIPAEPYRSIKDDAFALMRRIVEEKIGGRRTA